MKSHNKTCMLSTTSINSIDCHRLSMPGLKTFLQYAYHLFLQELVERYSSLFKIAADEVAIVIEILRENAVTKLTSNRKFKACGVATIKLKFADKTTGFRNEVIETGLHVNGSHLKEKIKVKLGQEDDIKLISHGRIVADGNF